MSAPSQHEIEQMAKLKAIMEGYAATDNTSAPLDESLMGQAESVLFDSNPVVREAATTSKIAGGVRVGGWEIITVADNGVKYFNVNNNGLTIASNLALYDTALAVCRMLNKGLTINSPVFLEILNLESEYLHYRGEAVTFKKRASQRRAEHDFDRADIAEARYTEARVNALAIREKIIAKSNTF